MAARLAAVCSIAREPFAVDLRLEESTPMSGNTYYMVLGVSEAETAGGIRAAYRDLAKRLYPDIAGEQSTVAFQNVAEAYDVLSNATPRGVQR